MDEWTFFADVAEAVAAVPAESIVSRVVLKSPRLNATVFAFDAGQGLSAHTAPVPAVIHILAGSGRLTLGEEEKVVQAGSWVHMPAHLTHSVWAETPLKMLLLLLKGAE